VYQQRRRRRQQLRLSLRLVREEAALRLREGQTPSVVLAWVRRQEQE